VRIFAFAGAQKADFPVRTLCRVCKVSPSGFYAWAARLAAGPGPAAVARQVAAGHIARVHAASRRRYGSPRVTVQPAREGITVNHKAVEREMARQGLAGRCSRRKIRTTRRDPSQVPAADLVRRDFTRPGTDELWIGDATYIWTDEGWCYLATVVDGSVAEPGFSTAMGQPGPVRRGMAAVTHRERDGSVSWRRPSRSPSTGASSCPAVSALQAQNGPLFCSAG
jgi:HTH-like domain